MKNTLLIFLIFFTYHAFANYTFEDINWIYGPKEVKIGDIAEIEIPSDSIFVPKEEMLKYCELSKQIFDPSRMGVLITDQYEINFSFAPIGYVEDDEKDELNSSKILKSIKEATRENNEILIERGWHSSCIDADSLEWFIKPNYNDITYNLEWCVGNDLFLNHQIRYLGRKGVMAVTVVMDPQDYYAAINNSSLALDTFNFGIGNRYADWVKGDKVAKIGLTGLIVGGAAVAAAKSGLLKFLWKIIIFIPLILIGFISTIWRKIKSLFSNKNDQYMVNDE